MPIFNFASKESAEIKKKIENPKKSKKCEKIIRDLKFAKMKETHQESIFMGFHL